MPDWFYRTVSRPALFRLPAAQARDFALSFMGRLGKTPFGATAIDFLGHMRAPEQLRQNRLGMIFPTAVGLGPRLDVNAVALKSLSRFGFGFIEIGPVTITPVAANPGVARDIPKQAIWFPEQAPNPGLAEIERKLDELKGLTLPIIVRASSLSESTCEQATDQCVEIIDRLGRPANSARIFSLDTLDRALTQGWSETEWREHVEKAIEACRRNPIPAPLLICVRSDASPAKIGRLIEPALELGCAGALIDGSIRADHFNQPAGRLIGSPARIPSLQLAAYLREKLGEDLTMIASGGVHEPEDAIALLEAGANLIQVDSGLVYSGPGLPKRINEALLFRALREEPVLSATQAAPRIFEMTWFWTMLIGIGMALGSLIALIIAATRVVLLYDESFVGLRRDELASINARLLSFMTHDRVTLAGVMLTIGILYVGLALGGVRRGLHWAQQAIFYSAFSGFLSFFLFLGFGYFDPFHAFVTAILFQFFLMALHSKLGDPQTLAAPNLKEDWRWRWNQWGQFLFVLHGFGLLGAGLAISIIGVSRVFVAEDLGFMQTTAEALHSANHRLVPLIAHDRATLGGMLIASGIAVLLPALWGFRQGERWLWWTLCLAGVPAYASAIGVHYAVGYINLWHLAPAFFALGVYLVGLTMSYPYLFQTELKNAAKTELN